MTVRPGPSNAIRLPCEEGLRPSPSSIMPALTSSSPVLPSLRQIQAGLHPALISNRCKLGMRFPPVHNLLTISRLSLARSYFLHRLTKVIQQNRPNSALLKLDKRVVIPFLTQIAMMRLDQATTDGDRLTISEAARRARCRRSLLRFVGAGNRLDNPAIAFVCSERSK